MESQNNGDMSSQSSNDDDPKGGLEGFITDQIKQQERQSRQADNLDIQKRDDFIARAISESARMNKEIEKSQAKRNQLHTEFGASRMNDWRNEHAAEVLTPYQQELVRQQHQ